MVILISLDKLSWLPDMVRLSQECVKNVGCVMMKSRYKDTVQKIMQRCGKQPKQMCHATQPQVCTLECSSACPNAPPPILWSLRV